MDVQLVATSQYGCIDSTEKSFLIEDQIIDLAVTNVTDVSNFGTVEITNFDIVVVIGDVTSIIEARTDTIAKSESITFSLGTQVAEPGSASGNYLCVTIENPNDSVDENISDNEMCINLIDRLEFVEIYPNPVTEQLYLNYIIPETANLSIEVYSMTGKLIDQILDKSVEKGMNRFSYNTSLLAPASYFVISRYKQEIVVRILVKM